jgi:hypothetical protein
MSKFCRGLRLQNEYRYAKSQNNTNLTLTGLTSYAYHNNDHHHAHNIMLLAANTVIPESPGVDKLQQQQHTQG